MSVVQLQDSTTGPLTPQHHQALALANQRTKKIRSAAKVAAFNGWVTSVFAICSAFYNLVDHSPVAILVTIGLSIVAYNEFWGRRLLGRLHPQSLRLLGWNQFGFMSLIVAYCVWTLYAGLTSPNQLTAEINKTPELATLLGDPTRFDALYKVLLWAVYGTVIVLTVVFQGGNALYYIYRERYLKQYLQETPEWIVKLQRMATPF